MIILQARCCMSDNEIDSWEEKMSKKTGKKVFIIPYKFEFIDSCIEGGVRNVSNSLGSTDS